jgi:hypothetical protein
MDRAVMAIPALNLPQGAGQLYVGRRNPPAQFSIVDNTYHSLIIGA